MFLVADSVFAEPPVVQLSVQLSSEDINIESHGLSVLAAASSSHTTLSESSTSLPTPTAPPLSGSDLTLLEDAVSPPTPSSITVHRGTILCKSHDLILPERYCVAKSHLYVLRQRQLARVVDTFDHPDSIVCFEDDGKYIVSHGDKIYTRQVDSVVGDLVSMYTLDDDGSVYPPDLHHHIQHTVQSQLLPSFAVNDGSVIFCQSICSPKLLVYPIEPGAVHEVPIQFSRNSRQPANKHQCTFITSGPAGYVLLLCAQYRDLGDPLELVLMVDVKDGCTKWASECQRTIEFTHDFYKLPQPIIYKNGYVYFMHDKTTIHVIDSRSGGCWCKMSGGGGSNNVIFLS